MLFGVVAFLTNKYFFKHFGEPDHPASQTGSKKVSETTATYLCVRINLAVC